MARSNSRGKWTRLALAAVNDYVLGQTRDRGHDNHINIYGDEFLMWIDKHNHIVLSLDGIHAYQEFKIIPVEE